MIYGKLIVLGVAFMTTVDHTIDMNLGIVAETHVSRFCSQELYYLIHIPLIDVDSVKECIVTYN